VLACSPITGWGWWAGRAVGFARTRVERPFSIGAACGTLALVADRVRSALDKEAYVTGWVGDIEKATKDNETFRTVIYTGTHAQLTVMSIEVGSEVGREVHGHLDQFLRIEKGHARVEFGPTEDEITETYEVKDDWAIIVPAGTWHNIVNTGDRPLKLYSIYSPPEHADGTVHRTKADADAAEAAEHAS
jgi:mannose-6-phosphate isomerase-like protein (cupin superfamily)